MNRNEELIVVNPVLQEDVDYIVEMVFNQTIQTECQCIGYGTSGNVYLYKELAIKVFHIDEEFIDTSDPIILEKLQGCDGFPTLFFYMKDVFMVTEYIEGCRLSDLAYHNILTLPDFNYILEGHIEFALKQGFLADDLHVDNMIITPDGYPIIIDVGSYVPLVGNEYNKHNLKLKNKIRQQLTNIERLESEIMVRTKTVI